MNAKVVHLIPAIKMPNDPKNLVLNEDGEKEWNEYEQKILEEKLKSEGNNISTILRLVGLLNGRTIQQITTRANWTLLPDSEKIPYEMYKRKEGKIETQVTLPPSTMKVSEIQKKKKSKHRHYSAYEGSDIQSIQRQRRRSMSRDLFKPGTTLKTGLSHSYQPIIINQQLACLSSNHESGQASPRVTSVSPNIGSMSIDMHSVSTEKTENQVDLSQVISIIQENENYLKMIEVSLENNTPIHGEVFLLLQQNMNNLLILSNSIAQPTPLPLFSKQLLLSEQLKALGMNDFIQSPSYLTLTL
ncbi:hypothetical protein ENUP19_0207G0003 [Entamoeba nuttalli]|uniref:Myb-like domain-containing protein n=1 Tax=Entamoeba nuttalli TaxID=412467 RepID=A0ABQ0DNY7_9EUKA